MNRLLTGVSSAAAAVLLTFAGNPGAALIGGVDSPDTPAANATVNVNGASGTLIAPDLVVTNGHVARVPLPAARPAFSRTDPHDPALWHPIPAANPVTVSIGAAPGRVVMTRSNPFTSPRTRWEVHDAGGGTLLDGDVIGLKTRGYFAFVDGGRRGGDLRIDTLRNRFAEWQSLTLEKVSGSEGATIRGGDRIALKARDGSYLAATRGNGLVVADAAVRAARHEFSILTFDGRGPLSDGVIEGGGTVAIGSAGSGGFMQAPYRLEGTAIATPGNEDIALIRLTEPVPESLAVPIPIKLRLDAGDAPMIEDFYRRASLKVAGYGLVAGGDPTGWRQEAAAGNAVRETPGGASLFSRYTARAAGRVNTQPGDSGGSWFVQSPRGSHLAGITQQAGNNFLTPMYRGGADSESKSKPDVHAWFSMLLADDDCVSVGQESGLRRETGTRINARTVCRFGDDGAPFAVAYTGAARSGTGADCLMFDATRLSLGRPTAPEGTGSTTWRLTDGPRQLMGIEGTWQQAYTRAAYLVSFLQRQGMNRICFSNRPNPSLIYFRD